MASKSLSLSLSGYFGDVQLLPVARECCPRAFDAVVELDLECAFEYDELAKVFDFSLLAASRCPSLEPLLYYFSGF